MPQNYLIAILHRQRRLCPKHSKQVQRTIIPTQKIWHKWHALKFNAWNKMWWWPYQQLPTKYTNRIGHPTYHIDFHLRSDDLINQLQKPSTYIRCSLYHWYGFARKKKSFSTILLAYPHFRRLKAETCRVHGNPQKQILRSRWSQHSRSQWWQSNLQLLPGLWSSGSWTTWSSFPSDLIDEELKQYSWDLKGQGHSLNWSLRRLG